MKILKYVILSQNQKNTYKSRIWTRQIINDFVLKKEFFFFLKNFWTKKLAHLISRYSVYKQYLVLIWNYLWYGYMVKNRWVTSRHVTSRWICLAVNRTPMGTTYLSWGNLILIPNIAFILTISKFDALIFSFRNFW